MYSLEFVSMLICSEIHPPATKKNKTKQQKKDKKGGCLMTSQIVNHPDHLPGNNGWLLGF